MKSPPANFGLGSAFDSFLFAPIAEDHNGLTLSVVSMLGRMNLDPWQAAASLAGLPAEAAIERLTAALNLLPGLPVQASDSRALAIHLVSLLPGRPDSNAFPLPVSATSGGPPYARPITKGIFLAIYLGVMLATQLVISHLAPTRVDTAHMQTSTATSSQTPPPAAVK